MNIGITVTESLQFEQESSGDDIDYSAVVNEATMMIVRMKERDFTPQSINADSEYYEAKSRMFYRQLQAHVGLIQFQNLFSYYGSKSKLYNPSIQSQRPDGIY